MHDRSVAEASLTQAGQPGTPLVTFFRFIPQCRPPQRADRSALGTIPTRAFRYCEAMTSASSFGWYLFLPMSFSLVWDGATDIAWTYEGAEGWYPLKAAQFPDFAAHFDSVAPPEIKGFSPPFLAVGPEPGLVQIWTGVVARSMPGWSLLVRPPANLPRSRGYDYYEGIIETDRWFGSLFSNVRLTRSDAPIAFNAELPFLQVQPVLRTLYGDVLDHFNVVGDLAELSPAEWNDYRRTVVTPNVDPHRRLGQYAAVTRRRRKRNGPAD
jgi:hypothetical protein